MTYIALVDDDKDALEELEQKFKRFIAENNAEIKVEAFNNAVDFLEQEHRFGIVFMDIEMPYINGMRAAQKLREEDKKIVLVFVTNNPNYAIEGYSVEAADYILKPVQYSRLSSLLKRVIRIAEREGEETVTIKSKGTLHRIYPSRIKYVQIEEHLLFYYTEDGRFDMWGSLKDAESQLENYPFVRCNYGTTVNLRFVKCIEKDTVILTDGTHLTFSRGRKKMFIEKLNAYLGG